MTFKRVFTLFLSILILPLLQGTSAFAEDKNIPSPIGDIYVQDFADILSPEEEQQLIRLGRSIDEHSTDQLAVLTVNTLGGMDIDEYANKAYRAYGLGTQEKDNGVLLVLAMKEKRIRIEVGYGLEGTITDGDAGQILDKYALPSLKAGQPNQAILNTYQALSKKVGGGDLGTGTEQVQPRQQPQDQGVGIPSWLIIILIIGFFILDFTLFGGSLSFALLSILGRGGGGGGGGGPRSGGGGSSGGGGAGRGW